MQPEQKENQWKPSLNKQVIYWPTTPELPNQLGIFLSWLILGYIHEVTHSCSLKRYSKDVLQRTLIQKP